MTVFIDRIDSPPGRSMTQVVFFFLLLCTLPPRCTLKLFHVHHGVREHADQLDSSGVRERDRVLAPGHRLDGPHVHARRPRVEELEGAQAAR